MTTKRYNNNSILTFGDVHEPFSHPDAMVFLSAVADKYGPDRVVHLGDQTDSYIFSHYSKALEADNVPTEVKQMREGTNKLAELFNDMEIMDSNHDSRLYRKAKSAGISRELIVPYATFLGVDDYNWKWHSDLTLTVDSNREQIYFAHTRTGTTLSLAKHIGMNAVTGHHHTRFGVDYYRSPSGIRWAVDTGCLISDKGHAFSYNAASAIRPVRGCCVILNGIPHAIPMYTKKSGVRWNGKVA